MTRDEGETYTMHEVEFHVDDIKFQSKDAEHSNDPPYNKYILAYDERNQSVSLNLTLHAVSSLKSSSLEPL